MELCLVAWASSAAAMMPLEGTCTRPMLLLSDRVSPHRGSTPPDNVCPKPTSFAPNLHRLPQTYIVCPKPTSTRRSRPVSCRAWRLCCDGQFLSDQRRRGGGKAAALSAHQSLSIGRDEQVLQHGDAERHIRQQKSGKVPKAK